MASSKPPAGYAVLDSLQLYQAILRRVEGTSTTPLRAAMITPDVRMPTVLVTFTEQEPALSPYRFVFRVVVPDYMHVFTPWEDELEVFGRDLNHAVLADVMELVFQFGIWLSGLIMQRVQDLMATQSEEGPNDDDIDGSALVRADRP